MYLIINGCPRKGNTWKLVEVAKEAIQSDNPDTVFEEIHLAEEKLPFCTGCSNCFRLGHEKCPHSEKMLKIIKAIEEAEGVIISSTTYFSRETSILKNLFDHLCFMTHRPHFFTSKALVITTTGGVGGKAAAKGIVSFLQSIGFNRCYQFSAASLSWNAYQVNSKTKTKLIRVTGKFVKDVRSGELHSPFCLLLIPYNLFRGMSLAYQRGTEYETQDGVYWTDEGRRNGVYDSAVKIPIYKKVFGQLFYLIGKYAGRKIIVTYRK